MHTHAHFNLDTISALEGEVRGEVALSINYQLAI